MSDRVKRHREKIDDLGFKTIELQLDKNLIHKFELLARYHHLHRNQYIGLFLTDICNRPFFKELVNVAQSHNLPLESKHKAEFTDYTLS